MAYRALSKSLSVVAVAVVLLAAGSAYADKDADKRAAGNSKLDTKTRMAACERLLAIEGLSKTERAWTSITRGGLYERIGLAESLHSGVYDVEVEGVFGEYC